MNTFSFSKFIALALSMSFSGALRLHAASPLRKVKLVATDQENIVARKAKRRRIDRQEDAQERNEFLFNAITTGNLQEFLAGLDHADLTARDPELHDTLLHLAVKSGSSPITQILLAHRINPDSQNKWLQTPLHYAARSGYVDLVYALLAFKACVNAKDVSNRTPLYLAAYCGYPEIVDALLKAGADSAITDDIERNALCAAQDRLQGELARNRRTTETMETEESFDPTTDLRQPLALRLKAVITKLEEHELLRARKQAQSDEDSSSSLISSTPAVPDIDF
ncbi:MAG: ankyrin repeat domain-containing protein [Candidatus Babeliales bacterium]|jgi:ankyrin repeat protein